MKNKIKIIVLIIIALIAGHYGYEHFIKFQNIFDQMYYTRVRDSDSFWILPNRGSFANMKELKSTTRDKENMYIDNGIFTEEYDKSFLNDNEQIYIDIVKTNKSIDFTYIWTFPKTEDINCVDNFLLSYTYDVNTKELVKNNIELRTKNEDDSSEITCKESDINAALERRNLILNDLESKQNWFMFEKILPDLFEGNKYHTRFSINDLGKVNIDNKKSK